MRGFITFSPASRPLITCEQHPQSKAKTAIPKAPATGAAPLILYAAPEDAAAGAEDAAAGELAAELAAEDAADVADAGPSQCQWSPCGSHPVEAVGLGGRTPALDAPLALEDVTAPVCGTPEDTGASQCQWSPWGSQPVEAVGLGGREDEVLLATPPERGPSQCLDFCK